MNTLVKFINLDTIKLEKKLGELDLLVLKFVNILKKHIDYVIISGYVSILLGRSRSTEDVDVFIKPLNLEKFVKLYQELKDNDFWCINAESNDEVYSYLNEGIALRFAEKGKAIPNFEIKFAKKLLDLIVFEDPLKVETNEGVILISSLDRQIAFKRYYLASDKDLEDAQYLEDTFKENINTEKIKKYKELINKYA